jgi:hypothetical protein
MRDRFHSVCLAIALSACGGAEDKPLPPGRPAPADPVAPPAPAEPDGPHISRSVGVEDGAIVFWPRVIPKTDDPKITAVATDLQRRLFDVTAKVVKKELIDMRPEPERVCPKAGCKAMTVGVLLTHSGGGCTAIALVSGAGTAPAELVPWGGKVSLAKTDVPFREYPENEVTIRDAVPCDQLASKLGERDGAVRAAIKAAR